jgi:hypothetical protein
LLLKGDPLNLCLLCKLDYEYTAPSQLLSFHTMDSENSNHCHGLDIYICPKMHPLEIQLMIVTILRCRTVYKVIDHHEGLNAIITRMSSLKTSKFPPPKTQSLLLFC